MTCFELTKRVTDETARAIFGRTDLTEEEGRQVHQQLADMSAAWGAGRAPALTTAVQRFGYLYCYVAAHAHLCELAMRSSQEIRALIVSKVRGQQPLRVCLFGGGPGTELIALTKFLSRRVAGEDPLTVEVLVLDKEPSWGENVATTGAVVGAALTEAHFEIEMNVTFNQFDFCADPGVMLDQIRGRDLYIFNHAVSEALNSLNTLEPLLASITESMPIGAVLLIADREQEAVLNGAMGLIQHTGLQEASQRGIRTMDFEEDCNALKDTYFNRINWHPRVKFGLAGLDQGAFTITGTKQEAQ
jgi:hypothetical protein